MEQGQSLDFEIDVRLRYSAKAPTDLLLHIEAANGCDQKVLQDTLKLNTIRADEGFPAEEGIGQRHWLHFESAFECDYNAVVQINRAENALEKLPQTPLSEIPADVVKYLMASRYCHLYKFDPFISEHFSGIFGGKLGHGDRVGIISVNMSFPNVRGSQAFWYSGKYIF